MPVNDGIISHREWGFAIEIAFDPKKSKSLLGKRQVKGFQLALLVRLDQTYIDLH